MAYYEGMFLFDPTNANKDWDGLVSHTHGIIEKAGAKILKSQKWDERKLAYMIKDMRRGVYLLVYFEAPTDALEKIKRDLRLSDKVVRNMILREDELPRIMAREEKEGTKGAGTGPSTSSTPSESSDKDDKKAKKETTKQGAA